MKGEKQSVPPEIWWIGKRFNMIVTKVIYNATCNMVDWKVSFPED
jgi:hypothetical protein